MTRVTGYLIATLALGLSACTNPMIPGLNFTRDLFKARNASVRVPSRLQS